MKKVLQGESQQRLEACLAFTGEETAWSLRAPLHGDVKEKDGKTCYAHTWHGPARVIGKDVNGYWLIHRGMPVLAHASQQHAACH